MEEMLDDFEQPMGQMNDAFVAKLKEQEWMELLGDEIISYAPKLKMNRAEFEQLFILNKDFSIPDVLCMGDVHTNNMLFDFDDNKDSTGDLHTLLDFQVGATLF